MKIYFYYIVLLSITLSQDVNIWISEIADNYIEISIKNTQNIYGFDFSINSYDESAIIDYSEESFTNGSATATLYTIDTGDGIVSNNNFHFVAHVHLN